MTTRPITHMRIVRAGKPRRPLLQRLTQLLSLLAWNAV